jgi:hypothetical protein
VALISWQPVCLGASASQGPASGRPQSGAPKSAALTSRDPKARLIHEMKASPAVWKTARRSRISRASPNEHGGMIDGIPNYVRLDAGVENRLAKAGLTAPLWNQAEADDPVGRAFLGLVESCIRHVCEILKISAPISFAVSRSHKAQAYAFQNEGKPFFVITSGLARGLTALSRHLALSEWQLLDNWPDAWIPRRPAFADRQAGLLHVFFCHCSLLSEADRARSALISQIATTFIVMHEIGHLVNGHLASGAYANGAISETAAEADANLALTRRALEYDADAFAVQHTLGIARGLVGRPTILGDETTPAQLIQLVMAGIATAQLFFEAFDPGSDPPLTQRTHPPAWVRLYNAMAMFDAIHARDMKSPPWRNLDIRRLNELVLLGREIALSDSGVPIMEEALNGTVPILMSSFTDEVRTRWLELRPRLMASKMGVPSLAL